MAETYQIAIVINGKDRASRPLMGVGDALRNVGQIAAGILAAQLFTRLASGIANMGRAALNAVTDYERLGLALQNLTAREILALNNGERFTAWMRDNLGATDYQINRYNALRGEYERVSKVIADMAAKGKSQTAYYAHLVKYQDTLQSQIKKIIPGYDQLSDTMKKAAFGGMDMAEALRASVEPSKELLKWSIQLAIHSPFTTKGVVDTMKTVMAYGFAVDEAKNLTRTIINFASATGASEEEMRRIALALGQVKNKGRLMGQEILQLTNAAVPVNDILANMGYTLDDVSKGIVDADSFIRAFTEYMDTNFAGAMERQMETWFGLRNTLADLKELGLKNLFEGLLGAMKPVVAQFTRWVWDEGLDRLKTMGERIGEITRLVVGLATGDFSSLSGLFQKWNIPPDTKDAIFQIVAGFDKLKQGDYAGAFEKIGGVVKEMFADLKGDAQGALKSLIPPKVQAGLKTAWIVLKDIGKAIKATLLPAWERVVDAFKRGMEPLQGLGAKTADWKRILVTLAEVLAGLVGAALVILVGFINGVARAIEWTMPFIAAFVNGVGVWVEGIIDVVQGLWKLLVAIFKGEDITAAMEQIAAGVKEIWQGLVQAVLSLFGSMIAAVLGLLVGFAEGVFKFFVNLYDELVGGNSIIPALIDDMVEAFARGALLALKFIADFVRDALRYFADLGVKGVAKVVEFGTDVRDTVKEWFGKAKETIKTALTETHAAIKERLEAIVGKVAEKVQAIKDLFNIASDLRSIGRDLINGLWEGMKAVWEDMKAWLLENTGALLDIIKIVTGTNSPSRKFAEIGRWWMEGLALGIRQMAQAPAVAVTAAAEGAMGAGVNNTWQLNFHNYGVQSFQEDDMLRAVNTARFLTGG